MKCWLYTSVPSVAPFAPGVVFCRICPPSVVMPTLVECKWPFIDVSVVFRDIVVLVVSFVCCTTCNCKHGKDEADINSDKFSLGELLPLFIPKNNIHSETFCEVLIAVMSVVVAEVAGPAIVMFYTMLVRIRTVGIVVVAFAVLAPARCFMCVCKLSYISERMTRVKSLTQEDNIPDSWSLRAWCKRSAPNLRPCFSLV